MSDDKYTLEELILMGAVEVAGIDAETGDMLYRFTDSMNEEFPEVQRRWEEAFHRELMYFWEKGLVDMNVTSPNPSIRITPKGATDDALNKVLTPDRKKMFIAFREMFKNREV